MKPNPLAAKPGAGTSSSSRSTYQQTVPTSEDLDAPPPYTTSPNISPARSSNSSFAGEDVPLNRRQPAPQPAPAVPQAVPDCGYAPQQAMSVDSEEARKGKFDDQPGAWCSDTGGCFFSSQGGCCFSSNEGCFFSSQGGCCFSSNEGCCCSDTKGCCCSTHEGCCCSDGAPISDRNESQRGNQC